MASNITIIYKGEKCAKQKMNCCALINTKNLHLRYQPFYYKFGNDQAVLPVNSGYRD
jgi:hypothetical protein